MNLDYPPEAEAFRTEFRAWLEDNLDPDLGSARGVMLVARLSRSRYRRSTS